MNRAEQVLRAAIAEQGHPNVLWTLEALPSDFYEAWSPELSTLEREGEVELSGRLTATNTPYRVTIPSENLYTTVKMRPGFHRIYLQGDPVGEVLRAYPCTPKPWRVAFYGTHSRAWKSFATFKAARSYLERL